MGAKLGELAVTIVLVPPSAWIAFRSAAASTTGYFILCAWLASATVITLFGLPYFIAAALMLVVIARRFRTRLDLKRWLKK